MDHISCPPHVEEGLAVLEQVRVPVDVEAVEPGQYGREIDPEDSLVFRKIVITEGLFERRRPCFPVAVGELALPAEVTPGVLYEKDAMTQNLLDL